MLPLTAEPVDTIAHVIQVALTPVFLLSGIGTLLNVLNTRHARVSDHTEHASDLLAAPGCADVVMLHRHLHRLRARVLALDLAIALSALGGAMTCGAALTLFVGVLRNTAAASVLFVLFGLALAFTVASLAAFIADTLLAWHGLREEGPLPHLRRQPQPPGTPAPP